MRAFCDTVRYKDLLDDAYADISNLIKSEGDVCAIVYCLERTACDDLSAHLSKFGISSAGIYMILPLAMCNRFQLTCTDDSAFFFFSIPCRAK